MDNNSGSSKDSGYEISIAPTTTSTTGVVNQPFASSSASSVGQQITQQVNPSAGQQTVQQVIPTAASDASGTGRDLSANDMGIENHELSNQEKQNYKNELIINGVDKKQYGFFK